MDKGYFDRKNNPLSNFLGGGEDSEAVEPYNPLDTFKRYYDNKEGLESD